MIPFSPTPPGNLFGRETPALPVDLLRVFVGVLSLGYFFTLWQEAADISGPDGLIDHALALDIFWFTRMGLFQPGMKLEILQGAYLLALVASLAVIAGWRTKPFAGLLFVTAVSAFRWNFLTAYVEDAIMNLLLFWLLLLPVGRTLTISEAWKNPRNAWVSWQKVRVPGTVVGCFLCNLALIYLVAGIWKWTSPTWRDGTALYVVLKLPISHAPDFWAPHHLPVLKVFNWAALVLEPLFPLAMLLRRGHPLKWLFLASLVGFHGGIVATMRIPFANLACLGAGVLIFREELMLWFANKSQRRLISPPAPETSAALSSGWKGRIAVAFVVILALSMTRNFPMGSDIKPVSYDSSKMAIDPRGSGGLSAVHELLYGALWAVGIAQEYQLFNWIDFRNHHVTYEVVEIDGDSRRTINPQDLFPGSNRSVLLQCYLHDLCWLKIPPARNAELKRSIAERFAQRYCRTYAPKGTIMVSAAIDRITATEEKNAPHRSPTPLFSFKLQAGKVLLEAPLSTPSLIHAASTPASPGPF